MDFKVAGTSNGITSLQMDIKIAGITEEIMKVALEQAKGGREHILGEMGKALTGARASLGEHAPRIETIKINPDKIRESIGSGGKVIREITEKTNTKIDINDDGTIRVAASDGKAIQAAINWIKGIASDPEVGQILRRHGRQGDGVRRLRELLRFSRRPRPHLQLSKEKVAQTKDVVKEGDKVKVKLMGFDDRGKTRLSMKVVGQQTGEDLEAKQKAEREAGRGE